CSSEGPCQVNSPWILVGLYPYQAHEGFPLWSAATTNDLGNVDLMDSFIEKFAGQLKILALRSTPLDIFGERIETRQRITWQHPPPMAQDIASVVVLRWF